MRPGLNRPGNWGLAFRVCIHHTCFNEARAESPGEYTQVVRQGLTIPALQ